MVDTLRSRAYRGNRGDAERRRLASHMERARTSGLRDALLAAVGAAVSFSLFVSLLPEPSDACYSR